MLSSDLYFDSQRRMKRQGKTSPDLFPSLGSRLYAQRCLRSTDVCGMQSSLTCSARGGITLKKFTVFWGFKVLSSLCCHIFKEVIVLCVFVCLFVSPSSSPSWRSALKDSQPFFSFVPPSSITGLLRNFSVQNSVTG